MGQILSGAPIFVGQFDVANFVFDGGGGLGSVDTVEAPNLIGLSGHDYEPPDDEDDPFDEDIITSFLVSVTSDATFDFYWGFFTYDEGPQYDPFGYYLNGSFFQLTDDGGNLVQGGFESVALQAGDVFGFYIDSTDGCCGYSIGAVSGDPVVLGEVPEPGTGLLALAGMGAIALIRRRR